MSIDDLNLNQINILIFVIILLLLVFIAVIIVLSLLHKKKKKNNNVSNYIDGDIIINSSEKTIDLSDKTIPLPAEYMSGTTVKTRITLTEISTGQSIIHDNQGITFIGKNAVLCNIVIADKTVSGVHCKLISDINGIAIEDMGAANGTYLNNSLLDTVTYLKNGDVIGIGNSQYRYTAEIME